ncbi:MAG: uroporphyrinogen decarboxylase family protein [Victivallales bacterium]|nr:uroporphyrinogen decarboxylase family protein [Victivallales bacterium]
MSIKFEGKHLPELLAFDYEHIRQSRERQCRFWRSGKVTPPLLFIGGKLSAEQEKIPDYNYAEIFTDKMKMLCREMKGACAAANGRSDMIPSIRANLGAGILLACLGLEQEAFPDKMPWLREHLSKERISKLSPSDIKPRGSFARGLEMMRYFREVMDASLPVYVMDTQGPFDLAHLMLGDELFIQLYDDPAFVHHLMNLCFELGLKTHRWMKAAIDEPITSLHHSCSIYSDSFGIRICEDTAVMLNPDHIEEFAMAYSRKLAREFGGAWVHYCGYNENLTDAILSYPEFKVLNFGHIPGHEYEIDFEKNMEKFAKAGKINFNHWPQYPGEILENYLLRLHKFAARGVLAPVVWYETGKELDCWNKLAVSEN